MNFDRKARTTTQGIAEKVLEKMYRYRDDATFELLGIPQSPHDVDTVPILWTAETLATELHNWADITLSRMHEVLEVLMNSGVLTWHDLPLRYYELTAAGKIEAEQLMKT